jgi:hypothetical protein
VSGLPIAVVLCATVIALIALYSTGSVFAPGVSHSGRDANRSIPSVCERNLATSFPLTLLPALSSGGANGAIAAGGIRITEAAGFVRSWKLPAIGRRCYPPRLRRCAAERHA